MPGDYLFENALFQAKYAQKSSKLTAILWHQGESDNQPDRVAIYKERFYTVMSTMKRELGLPENFPVIMGELSHHISEQNDPGRYTLQLNEAFHEIANETP